MKRVIIAALAKWKADIWTLDDDEPLNAVLGRTTTKTPIEWNATGAIYAGLSNRPRGVRTDIRRCADGVRVKVSVQNPKNVVGAAEVEARTYAVICCQLWSIIAAQSAEKLKIHLHADEQVIADALDANRRAEERKAAKEVHDGHSH